MGLQVVGAGLGRTGTHSLKLALERLLGQPCYHMVEVFPRPDHAESWRAAMTGDLPDWDALFAGFAATVDWPGGALWRELAAAYPDAVVLLSTRESGDAWWRSAERTIFEGFRLGHEPPPELKAWSEMATTMIVERFTPNFLEREEAIAAYERHNQAVRSETPSERLVDWKPGDGWEPLCDALSVAVPDEPFPHSNTTAEFRSRAGWD